MTRVRPRCFDGPDDGPDDGPQDSPVADLDITKQHAAPKNLTVLNLSLP